MQGYSKQDAAQPKAPTPIWPDQDLRILHDIQTYLTHDSTRQKYNNRDRLLKVLGRLFLPSYSLESIKQTLAQLSSDTLPVTLSASEPGSLDELSLKNHRPQRPRMARTRLRPKPYSAHQSAKDRKRALDAALGLDQGPSTLPNSVEE
ncbi:hypothetical protein H4R34_001394 [Dimargaris verticillata]|uniref:Uncharacterized protein n=1 Tax=Dimargaris verticillata TaxID=2761393 RepID=A0A9W8EF06_9FUNG|nr:hypothetical protein H4R34_001394 [Dimargaris verticillata]